MCELLGLNANLPSDIRSSLNVLTQRGSGNSPHRDGWGIAFYNAAELRLFRDPASISESALVQTLQNQTFESATMIAHIRQANVGKIGLANTHPFTRKLWGQHWTFAHNGQLKDFTAARGHYAPVGETDSEAVFCDLLNQIRSSYPEPESHERVVPFMAEACSRYRKKGPLNCLISNSEWLFAYCSTKLASITHRKNLRSSRPADNLSNTENACSEAITTIIATEPLTPQDPWVSLRAGEWKLWRNGALLAEGLAC